MTRHLGLTLAATFVLAIAGLAGAASKSAAGPAHQLSEIPTDISSAKKGPGGGGKAGGGGGGKPGGAHVQHKVSGPAIRHGASKPVIRQSVSKPTIQRHVDKRAIQRDIGKSKISKSKIDKSKFDKSKISQQTKLTPQSKFSQVKIRNASKVMVAGRNYSVWRGSHRVRRGGHWRTFVGLSTLGALLFGTAYYYPYAYIDTPAPYCSGLTDDGCQLRWREVPTIEGPPEFQCVAYCPWQ